MHTTTSVPLLLFAILTLSVHNCFVRCEDHAGGQAEMTAEEHVEVDSEKLEYAKGSVCGYCTYCKVS